MAKTRINLTIELNAAQQKTLADFIDVAGVSTSSALRTLLLLGFHSFSNVQIALNASALEPSAEPLIPSMAVES